LNEIASRGRESQDCVAIASRCNAQVAHERAGHMALVGEAGLDRSLGRCLTISQKLSCKADASLNEIGMGRCSDLASKTPQELEAAYTGQGG
jgi:hypothetical protein